MSLLVTLNNLGSNSAVVDIVESTRDRFILHYTTLSKMCEYNDKHYVPAVLYNQTLYKH